MDPISLVIAPWLQNVILVAGFAAFVAGAFIGAGRKDRGRRGGGLIALGGVVVAVAVFAVTYPVLGIPQDARAAAIEKTYGIELDHLQLNELGYSAQTEIDTDADPYILGTLLVDQADGTVDLLRLAWDGEHVILTDGDNVELPRR